MVKVSIIVPVFNTKKEYLDKCIESLVNQTLKDIELIFVDDGSTDDSLEYLRSKEQKYPQMRVIAQNENRCQGGARNTGIQLAQGDYIAFCDSDDFVDTTIYEKLYRKIVSKPDYDAVRCYHKIWDERYGFREIQDTLKKDVQKLDGVALDADDRVLVLGGGVWDYLINKDFFVNNNLWFPEHRKYEDNYTRELLLLQVNKLGFVDEDLYFYRKNEESTIHNPVWLKDRIWIEDEKVKELKKRNLYQANARCIEFHYYMLAYVNLILQMMDLKCSAKDIFLTYYSQKGKLTTQFPYYRQNKYIINLMNEDPARKKWYLMFDRVFPIYFCLKMLISFAAKIRA